MLSAILSSSMIFLSSLPFSPYVTDNIEELVFAEDMTNAVSEDSTVISDTVIPVNNIVINQGDDIRTLEYSCSLGYIGDDFAITAGHCGDVGETVYDSYGNRIGVYAISENYGYRDVAIIDLENNVTGANKYSGDYIVSINKINKFDTICQYGNVSQKVHCSKQKVEPHDGFFWSASPVIPGDSGGPAWVEGKGLIGIIVSKQPRGGTGISEVLPVVKNYGANIPINELNHNSPTLNFLGSS